MQLNRSIFDEQGICKYCHGTKTEYDECEVCKGSGWMLGYHPGVYCSECKGTRFTERKCSGCLGIGKKVINKNFLADGRTGDFYLRANIQHNTFQC